MTDQDEFASLVFSFATAKEERLRREGLKLAHYTSAATGMQILLNKVLWLRNASSMNDFMEIQHGTNCLHHSIGAHRDRFRAVIGAIAPDMPAKIAKMLDDSAWNRFHHTYLTSLSEHGPDDTVGRLSMWRAYGGESGGVAIVFNSHFMDFDVGDLAVWSSPVMYAEPTQYEIDFLRMLDNLERSKPLIARLDAGWVEATITAALEFSVLSTKHPGFEEEQEWRLIHHPQSNPSAMITKTFKDVRDAPETVYLLPLEETPAHDLRPGYNLDQLIHRIIIGPCAHPIQVAGTFQELLGDLGVSNPASRITHSMIPLRRKA